MDQEILRIDFIHAVSSKLQGMEPGRTALMKLAYFAQELRGVPLGYNFSLYSYGPFDSSVLSDLDIAQAMKAVSVKVIYHGFGYGYQINACQEWKLDNAIGEYEKEINAIVNRFGRLRPAELELLSTLIYVDRDANDKGRKLSLDRLTDETHEIKPHFSKLAILTKAEELAREGFLHMSRGVTV